MKPGNPWSVKGIQPAAREAAKEAARRHGMTLGQWLNHVIMDSNEEQAEPIARQPPDTAIDQPVVHNKPQALLVQPPSPPPSTPQKTAVTAPHSQRLHDKIEDLAAKLDTIVNKQSGQVDLDQWQTEKNRSTGWNDIAVRNIKREATPVNTRQPEPDLEPENKTEIFGERISALTDKLDDAVQARAVTLSRSDKSLMDLETSLRNVIGHIENSDRQNTEVMKKIQARLSELSSRNSASDNDAIQQLSKTMSQVDDRLSYLSRRVMKTETDAESFQSFDEKMNILAKRLDDSLDRKTEPQIVALEEQIKQLALQLDEYLQVSDESKIADQYETRLDEISNQVKNTEQHYNRLSSLEDSISQLYEAVERNKITVQDNIFSASQKSIETVETMVEQAAHKAAQTAAQRSAEHVAAIMADDGLNKKEVIATIEDLRNEMHKLQEATLQTAQRNTEEAVSTGSSVQATEAIVEPMMKLQQKFDQLQESSKSAELHNQDTLEAVHDTLEKVVERLVTLETLPLQHEDRPPLPSLSIPEIKITAPASSEPGFHISDDIEDETETEAEENPDLETQAEDGNHSEYSQALSSSQPEQRIEPVFGKENAELKSSGKGATDATGPALNHNYLEAARRAAQAASQMPRQLADIAENKVEDKECQAEPKGSLLAMATESDKKRKTLLLVAAGVLLVIGALSAGSMITDRSSNIAGSSVKLPASTTPANDPVSSTAKTNKEPAGEQPATPDKVARPDVSPVSQNTPQSSIKTVQVSSTEPIPGAALPAANNETSLTSSTTAPRTTASVAPAGQPNGATVAEPAANSVKVARLGSSASNQPALATEASRTEPPLPEAIGPIALRRAATTGDATAQFEIAVRYTAGKLVPQNFSKAIYWYQKAAAQNLAPAQYRLGTFYEKGRGVTQDKTTARTWYERAAAKGNLKAIHNLAVIHADGSKGKPDFAKAGLWFRKAAELGLADSQYNLAILHDRGLGVSKDQSAAYFWFKIADSQGDKDAGARAAIIEKRMTPDQIARTRLLISNWSPRTLNKSANEVALPFDGWQSANLAQSPTTGKKNSSFTHKELVVLTQGYLTRLGFDPGPDDGIMGAQTRTAIEEFQQQNQLPVSGDVSPELVNRLKAAAG